jgi:hypothetical protein
MKSLSFIQSIARMGFVTLFLAACMAKSERIPGLPKSKKLSEKGNRSWKKKEQLDSLMKRRKQNIEVFVSRVGADSIHRVRMGEFPDNIRSTFNLFHDEAGRLRVASEFPFSESGDWSIRLTHYFDAKGRLFAFERNLNFFNSVCTPGMASENRNILFDTSGRRTDSIYHLVDSENKALKRKDCQFPYDYPYTIHKSTSEWMADKKFPHPGNR